MNNQIKSYNSTVSAMTMAIITLLLFPHNSSAQTASYSQFTRHIKAGLSISLPKELSRLTEEKVESEMTSIEKYTAVNETRSLIIKHFSMKVAMDITNTQSADLQENDMKNQPGYSSSRKKVTINATQCLILVMKYEPTIKQTRVKVSQTVLYFSKGTHMWEVQIFGVNEPNQKSLESMKNKIFKSIKIIN